MNAVPPGFIFLLGSFFIPLLKGKIKRIYLLFVPLIAFIDLIVVGQQTSYFFSFMGMELILLKADELSLFVGYIFALIGFLGLLYSINVKDDRQHFSVFWYIGSSLCIVFAGDFFTLLFFWEIMAISSTFLIWLQGDKESLDAGFRYFIMHLFGGGCLLAGVVTNYVATGSLQVAPVESGIQYLLILVGVGVNTVFIPLHTWLPDAYPRATLTGAVFMSAYTTKAGVYVLARTFSGVEAVAYMGGLMALYGVTFALLQNDIRRLLSYHIISQVGYMVAGIGIGTSLAFNGGIAHLFNHIIYKALLFMCAGAIIYSTGKSKLTELGGLVKKMPITTLAFTVAALSISGFIGFNGFVSKGMVIEAAHSKQLLWLLLELASVGTILSFLKMGYYGFFRKRGIEAKEASLTMIAAMVIASFLCIFLGFFPDLILNLLPYESDYKPFAVEHILGTIQLFSVVCIVFLVVAQILEPYDKPISDFDSFYRLLAHSFLWFCRKPLNAIASTLNDVTTKAAYSFLWFTKNPMNGIKYLSTRIHLIVLELMKAEHAIEVKIRLEEQKLMHMKKDEQISIGFTILMVVIVLLLYLLIYELRV